MLDSPALFHCGQVLVDLTMQIDHLPGKGEDIFARGFASHAGGGFNVLFAARQMNAPAYYCGPIGTGLHATEVLSSLSKIGVSCLGPRLKNVDTGFCVALTEDDGERTFVSTAGAETMPTENAYDNLPIGPSDIVYISGYSFVSEKSTAAMFRLLERHQADPPLYVFDTSPVVDKIPLEVLHSLTQAHPLWSVNERESRILAGRLALPRDRNLAVRAKALADSLHAPVVLRAGHQGSFFCDQTENVLQHISPVPVSPVDTNGAGDTHCGVLAAKLLQGASMQEALIWANCAAALSTEQHGPATCPTYELVSQKMSERT